MQKIADANLTLQGLNPSFFFEWNPWGLVAWCPEPSEPDAKLGAWQAWADQAHRRPTWLEASPIRNEGWMGLQPDDPEAPAWLAVPDTGAAVRSFVELHGAGVILIRGPPPDQVASANLLLGNHSVVGAALPGDVDGHSVWAFGLDPRQQAAVVLGAPQIHWTGPQGSHQFRFEGPAHDSLRAQLPETFQFAVTFVEDD